MAKRIPFRNPDELKKALLDHDSGLFKGILYRISHEAGDKRMPPSKSLEKRDEEEIVKFMRELISN